MYNRKCESLKHIFVKENTQDNWFTIHTTSKLYTYACSCLAVFPSIHFRIHSNVDLHNQACIGTDQYPEGKTRTSADTGYNPIFSERGQLKEEENKHVEQECYHCQWECIPTGETRLPKSFDICIQKGQNMTCSRNSVLNKTCNDNRLL